MEKLISFLSLEEVKGKDCYSIQKFSMFKVEYCVEEDEEFMKCILVCTIIIVLL